MLYLGSGNTHNYRIISKKIPDQIVPDQIVPDQIVPDQIVPDQIVPDQIIPEYCNQYPNVWTNKSLETDFIDILLYLNELFIGNNIDYTIAFGTALGYQRHGDFIPWDDDLDVLVKKNDSVLGRSLVKAPFCTSTFWGGWKVYKCDSPNAGKYKWKYPFVDVFDNGNTDVKFLKNSAHDHIMFPSKPATMHGVNIRIPNNITKHLTVRYGLSYMTVCSSPWRDHKNERGIKNTKTHQCDLVIKNCLGPT